ncbi:hypothetical protein OFC04_25335, partial [Escherichia coli]|nr:hypothetical protein [Escherichia coli]
IINLLIAMLIEISFNYKFEILIIRIFNINIVEEVKYGIKLLLFKIRDLLSKYNYINNILNEEILAEFKVEFENKDIVYEIIEFLNGTTDIE